ncbi:activator of 2-hydroxyglutaryl-CoA dehydratase [Dehalogenimonas sp. WBC-2]|nr:activator of 2-hydroxyglutaryl-CoA dehydratase [Dehalogenimonas sp. WBC-2]
MPQNSCTRTDTVSHYLNYMSEIVIGIDVGSVSTKTVALCDRDSELLTSICYPTCGDPLGVASRSLREISQTLEGNISGIAVTGSARELVGNAIEADIIKNEITCQALAATHFYPSARTIIEIGGQDSKLIFLRDGLVQDFSMNTVCAAGTGSFLEHQARRLGLDMSDFAVRAANSQSPVKIAGRCTVFTESDMIHAQQTGAALNDVIFGLCLALCNNFLSDAGRARVVEQPVIFQGGVALNSGMVRAFEKILNATIIVQVRPELTGAIGAALLLIKDLEHNKGCLLRSQTRRISWDGMGRG